MSDFHLVSDRDILALKFIGEGFEVSQYQLHEALFPGRVATVVSRFVRRAVRQGFLVAERVQGFGVNRLRLTRRGCEVLCAHFPDEEKHFFAPRRAVSAKDVYHTTLVNDLRVAFLTSAWRPNEIAPAWLLQRQLGSGASVVPDLLAVWQRTADHPPAVVGCEIDMGGEPLTSVFVPKLRRLAETIGSRTGRLSDLLVFTRGVKRLKYLMRATENLPITRAGFLLPEHPGLASIAYFRFVIESRLADLLSPKPPVASEAKSLQIRQ